MKLFRPALVVLMLLAVTACATTVNQETLAQALQKSRDDLANARAALVATSQAAATQPGGKKIEETANRGISGIDKTTPYVEAAHEVASQPDVGSAIAVGIQKGLEIQHTVAPQYDAYAYAIGAALGLAGILVGHRTATKAIQQPGVTEQIASPAPAPPVAKPEAPK